MADRLCWRSKQNCCTAASESRCRKWKSPGIVLRALCLALRACSSRFVRQWHEPMHEPRCRWLCANFRRRNIGNALGGATSVALRHFGKLPSAPAPVQQFRLRSDTSGEPNKRSCLRAVALHHVVNSAAAAAASVPANVAYDLFTFSVYLPVSTSLSPLLSLFLTLQAVSWTGSSSWRLPLRRENCFK